ncbi:MAG: outer membrane protein assembly factor BamD [Parasulfuritortus sp.]|nr:outer membrane protein assembly factor BamD [Parasulfuritortus sp.]
MKQILAVLLAATLLNACGLLPEQIDETKNWSASKLYDKAKTELLDSNYTDAVKYFEKLEARYPYGPYAQQAQLEEAYAYYKDNEPVSAIAACDRFIKLHPDHANVDYAYYLKGLANFKDDLGLFSGFSNQDLSERDPLAANEAFEAFKELTTRFPNSKYTPDGLARMKYLVNSLASHEVHVASYYYERGAYVAAVDRIKYLLEHYQQAPAVEQGLVIMAKSYDKLGIYDLRDDTLRVLKKNFPNSTLMDGNTIKKGKPWWRFW